VGCGVLPGLPLATRNADFVEHDGLELVTE
jgi:hypothetical protein